MSHRVPYEVLAPQAEMIYQKMVSSSSPEEMDLLHEKYVALIEACGWTVPEYDIEQSKRVEVDWDTTPPLN